MPSSPSRSRRSTRAVYRAVLDALDHVLEEGIPRGAVVGVPLEVVFEWERALMHAEASVSALRARWTRVRAGDPALVPLVVVARAVAAGARAAGLGPAIDAGGLPAVAELERTLAAALAHARAAHDAALQAALSGSAA